MNKRFFAIILAVLLGISAIAIAEMACPRMGGMMCGRQNESCPMKDGSCTMMNGETCAMQGECTMQNGETCAMQGECTMQNGEACAMQGGSCPMMNGETCAMQTSSASVPSGMPCARADHALFEGTLPAGYHFTLCEDCTLVTGTDFYLCMSACEICGMHVHAQESEHDCPIISWLLA